ncbi:MAG: alpha-L-fucosidase [Chloroflexota bacterium]
MSIEFPLRTIHLDFHTGPAIPDVGHEFDANTFADTFEQAHVDSVTVFASCHHGHLYYDTDRPERHPSLPTGLDLLGEQIEALHSRNIRAPIYMTVEFNEYAANTYPGWVAIDPEGRQIKRGGPLEAGWHIMDMSSPYQDFLAEQIDEVLRKYSPIDGLFLDITWDVVSCSRWAIDGMRKQGYDPRDPTDRQKYARAVCHQFMGRFKKMVDDAHQNHKPAGVWFNSRPKTNLHIEKKFLRHVEIECLPTGGWGYAYFPYVARFVRPLNLPTLCHTARFHKSWADFGGLKPEAAMKYECCLILSQGLTNGIGDQLHPRGTLNQTVYDQIGRVYSHIEACEPWVVGGELQSQIGVVIDPEDGDRPGAGGLGLIRALQQLRQQFDLLPATADLSTYELVIVPEMVSVDTGLKEKLQTYLHQGGSLIISGDAALDETGQPIMPELGITTAGASPFTVTYLQMEEAVHHGIPEMDHVMYEPGFRMQPSANADSLAKVVEPYFERTYAHFCSHRQTPSNVASDYAAVVQHDRVITIALPIFTAYGEHGNLPYRDLLGNCIKRLLPAPLICDEGPAHLETTVVRKGDNLIVHVISFYPERRTPTMDIIENPFPLVKMPLAIKVDQSPDQVLLVPGETPMEFDYQDGYVQVNVTLLDGHGMIVLTNV